MSPAAVDEAFAAITDGIMREVHTQRILRSRAAAATFRARKRAGR